MHGATMKISRAIPLLPLWARVACYRVKHYHTFIRFDYGREMVAQRISACRLHHTGHSSDTGGCGRGIFKCNGG